LLATDQIIGDYTPENALDRGQTDRVITPTQAGFRLGRATLHVSLAALTHMSQWTPTTTAINQYL